jgi:hypothetical protein
LYDVGDQGVGGELVVDADVVVLAVVHDELQVDVGEAFEEGGLGAVLLGRGVSAGVDDEFAAVRQGGPVQLVERPGLLGPAGPPTASRTGTAPGSPSARSASASCTTSPRPTRTPRSPRST